MSEGDAGKEVDVELSESTSSLFRLFLRVLKERRVDFFSFFESLNDLAELFRSPFSDSPFIMASSAAAERAGEESENVVLLLVLDMLGVSDVVSSVLLFGSSTDAFLLFVFSLSSTVTEFCE